MDETDSTESSQTLAPAAPQLGIRHFFLWMTCSAVLLTIYLVIRSTIINVLGSGFENHVFRQLRDAYMCIVEGPAIAALGLVLTRYRRGIPFPKQPGEWPGAMPTLAWA